MNHPEPDLLDALAYGMLEAPLLGETRAHVRDCPRCAERLRMARTEAARLGASLGRPRRRWLAAAAAVLALAAVVTTILRPGADSIVLPDGTEILARGDVRVLGDRTVSVARGRADLDVAHGAVPFVVETPAADIEVVGTRFTVNVEERTMGTGRMLVTAVAVTAGVVAVGNQLGWIELVPGEHAVVARDRAPRRAGASSATAEDLRSELARLSAQEKRLAGEVQALRAESPAVPAAAPAESEIPEPEIPEPIRRAAAELGVSDAAIGAAVRADRAFRASPYGAHEAEIAALVALGEDGFRAVVALLKAGRGGIWFDRLFEATMAPGREALLLALSEDEDAMRRSGWSILTGLGFADTPEVRDYLLARLEREGREEDAGQFMSAAEALARLKEPRAAVFFEGKLARKGWSGVRGSLLNALGKIGGPDARRILLEYIRDPNSENPGSAVRALGQFDRVAAKEEARSLLSGPRRAFLKSYELRCLEEAAGSK